MTILKPFFEEPNRKFSIRELSRILKVNHTTVRQHLNNLAKDRFLFSKKEGVYTFFRLINSRKITYLKLYYNLEKLRDSGLLEELERFFDLPIIVVFGSFASATDDMTSDIDLCIITNVNKDFSFEKYGKKLNRKISIHKFTKAQWVKAKTSRPALINNICNGIVLSGELEVV